MQVTTATVVCAFPSPVVSLVGVNGARQSEALVQAAGMSEPALSPRSTGGDNQVQPDTLTAKKGAAKELENLWP